MPGRESLAQARDNLARAREEVEARYHEWAALLAKEAAQDALRVVAREHGTGPPAADEVAPLVEPALGALPADDPVRVAAQRLDAIHDPVEVDLETASHAVREGGKADYVTGEDAREAIERAATIVDACRARLDEAEDGDGDEA
jgi:HEPN domain-containing protein